MRLCVGDGRSRDGMKEVMMIELQGELKCLPHVSMEGKLLGDLHFTKQVLLLSLLWDNMDMTLPSSPEVNTYLSDRIKVAEFHAIYINFRKLVKAK